MAKHYFDTLAESYDNSFTHSAAGKAQRKMVWKYAAAYLDNPPRDILEINCGTGEDAIMLAKVGHHITATDKSPKMIQQVRLKSEQVRMNVHSYTWDFTTPFPEEKQFDIIFSNFGGLNCVSPSTLATVFERLSGLLKENGVIILVVIGRNCPWEKWLFRLKGNFKAVHRRSLNTPVYAKSDIEMVSPVWYYNTNEILETAGTGFKLNASIPVGLFIPPVYGKAAFWHFKWLIALCSVMEKRFARKKIFQDTGDHLFICIEKFTD